MGRLAVINAPSSFTMIWNIVKRWISPETVSKVDILGKHPFQSERVSSIISRPFCFFFLFVFFSPGSDYTGRLLEDIDAENLPTSLGGLCTCEGLGGCSLSSAGPWLDQRVYKGHGPSRYRASDQQANSDQRADSDQQADSDLQADSDQHTDSDQHADSDLPVQGGDVNGVSAEHRDSAEDMPLSDGHAIGDRVEEAANGQGLETRAEENGVA